MTGLGIYVEELYNKQHEQLRRLCEEFQPYTEEYEVVFLEVIRAAREYCDSRRYPFMNDRDERKDKEIRFDKLLIGIMIEEIRSRYYFNGIKFANRELRKKHYEEIRKVAKCPTAGIGVDKYRPAELQLFMKEVRACRDFMRAKMSKESEQTFYDKLQVIRKAMRSTF